MKVVVAHGPDNDVRELRKLLHGTGAALRRRGLCRMG